MFISWHFNNFQSLLLWSIYISASNTLFFGKICCHLVLGQQWRKRLGIIVAFLDFLPTVSVSSVKRSQDVQWQFIDHRSDHFLGSMFMISSIKNAALEVCSGVLWGCSMELSFIVITHSHFWLQYKYVNSSIFCMDKGPQYNSQWSRYQHFCWRKKKSVDWICQFHITQIIFKWLEFVFLNHCLLLQSCLVVKEGFKRTNKAYPKIYSFDKLHFYLIWCPWACSCFKHQCISCNRMLTLIR